MNVAVVKYNAGNTASVVNALESLDVSATISDDPDVLSSADKVIFPGVGEASSAMKYLRARNLDATIRSLTQPVLGICLGMHLLCSASEENDTECLGIVPQRVRLFSDDRNLKVPHMGWNIIEELRSPLFDGINAGEYFYFVHSYFVEKGDATTAVCNYGESFSAAFHHENFYAVQFHAEKSGKIGQRVLENFLRL